jgi:dipeptidyl aminopeptidase/acylaminoacyl peptidase
MNLARTIATATIVLLALAAAPAAPATLVSLEDFAKDEAVSLVRLSPDGKRIAIVYSRAGINNLAVIEIATMAANVVAGFKLPGQIGWVRWVSDERMVLEVHEWVAGRAFVSSLVTVRRNDQRPAYLFDNRRAPVNWYVDESIVDLVKGSPDEILLQSNLRNAEFPDVHRLQLAQPHTPTPNAQARTNLDYAPTKRSIEVTAPARACDYLADHAGVVRSCLSYEVDGSMRLMYRASATAEWSELEKYSLNAPYLLPVGFTPDNARILALSNVDRDRRALVEYDPAERRATQVVYEHPEVDLASALFSPTDGRLMAVTWYSEVGEVWYFDGSASRVHGEVARLFPGRSVRIVNHDADRKIYLVSIGSDRDPGTYYLVDLANSKVRPLLKVAPWIVPAMMSEVKAVRFKARDGLELSGYLTLPRDRKPEKLPLIVHPHGGPHGVRDYASFDPMVQFLASRGYAVLQVNFRGSGGFGLEFRRAGYREWGQKMQDDLADGAAWALEQGIADPARVGIFGGSYGGYAALMGLVRHPELYRVGLSFAGVSDLEGVFDTEIRSRGWYRRRSKAELRYWEDVIGSRRDKETLRSLSPLHNVDAIRAPVFIAHGQMDFTVEYEQATRLRDALKKRGATYDFLGVLDDGHGFVQEKNRIELYRRMEKFLAAHMPSDELRGGGP